MVAEHGLLTAVDAAFGSTGRGMAPWADPHPDRSPLEAEYSRLTNSSKWRIIGARADASVVALVDARLATVGPSAEVRWRDPRNGDLTHRAGRAASSRALPLVVARSRLGYVGDAGVTLGVGDPAVYVTWAPALRVRSLRQRFQDVLDELDAHMLGIVSGAFLRLSSGDREITVTDDGSWRGSNLTHHDLNRVLADATGWDEVAGASWLRPAREAPFVEHQVPHYDLTRSSVV